MSLGWPAVLVFGLVAALAVAVVCWRRHGAIAIAFGVATLAAFAAGSDMRIRLSRAPIIAVLIDASPSTRGMWFRDGKTAKRIGNKIAANLATGATVKWFTFADGDLRALNDASIHEETSQRTSLPAVNADAIVLLSDGQLDASNASATPIYPVVVERDATADARMTGIENDGEQLIVSVKNDGPPRRLLWADGASSLVPHGTIQLTHALSIERGSVHLDSGDAWPENDSFGFGPAPAFASERWCIGEAAPPGFRSLLPTSLPPPGAWSAARVVVLNNVPADALDSSAKQSIVSYVRNFGGATVIVGGARAFSAGDYAGTELDALSPLASAQPEARSEWLILIDSSGSMAAKTADGQSRLDLAIDAATAIADALPAADRVAFASFARDFRAWATRDDRRPSAPPGLDANGPTNLRGAFDAIARTRGSKKTLPLHIITLTDGEAELGEMSTLQANLSAAGIVIDWVALAADADRPLATVASSTGGRVIDAGTPTQWRSQSAAAIRAVGKIPAKTASQRVRWLNELAKIGAIDVDGLNTVYLREGAESLATVTDASTAGTDGDTPTTVAARWRVGDGQVAALAFAATPDVVAALSDLIETPPRDPRLAVRWSNDAVIVNAVDGGAAMTDLKLTGRDADSPALDFALEQTAPGKYEGKITMSIDARTIVLYEGNRIVDARAMPAAIAPECTSIGIDRAALDQLARHTGGRVIDADTPTSAGIALPRRDASLAIALLTLSASAALSALALGRLSIVRR